MNYGSFNLTVWEWWSQLW